MNLSWALSVTKPPVLHLIRKPEKGDLEPRPALCSAQAVPSRTVAGFVSMCPDCDAVTKAST